MINPKTMQPQWVISLIHIVFIDIWAFIKGWQLFVCEALINGPVIKRQILVHSFGEFPIKIEMVHGRMLQKTS